MKMWYTEQIEKIEIQLSNTSSQNVSITNLLETGISKLLIMTNAYENADSDKLHFENGAVRINRVNEIVKCIYQVTNDV